MPLIPPTLFCDSVYRLIVLHHITYLFTYLLTSLVDGVAQWLGCRSLAARLSLICAQSMVHCVGELSAVGHSSRPTLLSIPLVSVNE